MNTFKQNKADESELVVTEKILEAIQSNEGLNANIKEKANVPILIAG